MRLMICQISGRDWSWPDLSHNLFIYVEKWGKTTKNFNQDSRPRN